MINKALNTEIQAEENNQGDLVFRVKEFKYRLEKELDDLERQNIYEKQINQIKDEIGIINAKLH